MGGEQPNWRRPMKKNEHLSIEQLALIFGISIKTVKILAKDNEIPCEYVNRRPRFKVNELINHFERLEGGAA